MDNTMINQKTSVILTQKEHCQGYQLPELKTKQQDCVIVNYLTI